MGRTNELAIWLHFLAYRLNCEIMQPDARACCRTKRMGRYPGKEEEMSEDQLGIKIPIVAIVSAFTFITILSWIDGRRKEREAFYRAETLRRITESSGEGAKAAIDLMKEDDQLRQIRKREGMKISGLINIGVGLGMVIGLSRLIGPKVALCGLVPACIGVAMLVYVYFLAAPVE
jgi:hypothetical protein